ncbi:MAG: hypothetical protein IJL26_06820 [Clostridia bacterium]|nr:hypothetical protein [Clostridia bacterium]
MSDKLWTVLRCAIVVAALIAAGAVFLIFGYKYGVGKPTTMQIILSIAYAGVTGLGALGLGISRKSGFVFGMLIAAVIAFPALPFSGIVLSPLFAFMSALDAGKYAVYILYEGAFFLLYGLGIVVRIVIDRLVKDGMLGVGTGRR